MTETKPSFLKKIDLQLEKISRLAFDKKFFPLTLIVIVLLFSSYAFLFYQWFFPHQQIEKQATTGAKVLLTQSEQVGDSASIKVAINLAQVQGRSIDGIQVISDLNGIVPDNIQFAPNNLDGLEPIIATIDHSGANPSLKVAFLCPPTQEYVISDQILELGTISFSQPNSGTMVFDFSPTLNKILEHGTLENILIQPEAQSYTF